MTEKQAIWKSILHWRRMIRFVERKCDLKDKADHEWLLCQIGETWTGLFCALCEYDAAQGRGYYCDQCLLAKKYGICGPSYPEEKNAWLSVWHAITWRGWLRAARRMLRQLESLREVK